MSPEFRAPGSGSAGRAENADLPARARAVRAQILRMCHAARTAHLGSSFSIVEILVALWFRVLRLEAKGPDAGESDRFILSKGHGAMALYACLAERGFLPREMLSGYARDGSRLAEHPLARCAPGIFFATGSLGHGLSLGAGLAYGLRLDGNPARVFVLVSDAELQEGALWEGALFAAAQRLDRVTAIVDQNGLQATGRTADILPVEPAGAKFEAFGWEAREADGHDLDALCAALSAPPAGRPRALVARTVKGKGVSFMENNLEYHYRPPDDETLAQALAEIQPDHASAQVHPFP